MVFVAATLGGLALKVVSDQRRRARLEGREPTDAPAGLLTVDVLDADGCWTRAALTSVPPVGDSEGDTLEAHGAAR